MPSFCVLNEFILCLGHHVLFSLVRVLIVDRVIVEAFRAEPVCLGLETLEFTIDVDSESTPLQ